MTPLPHEQKEKAMIFPSAKLADKDLISFDTEFVDAGDHLALISIGLVRADGSELYLENRDFMADSGHLVDDWMADHVLAKTFLMTAPNDSRIVGRDEMAGRVLDFVTETGRKPSLWAHYASYDWVALCQLYGRMLDLPDAFPRFAMDFRVAQDLSGVKPPSQSKVNSHHALIDARWGKLAFEALGIPFQKFDAERDLLLPEPEPVLLLEL